VTFKSYNFTAVSGTQETHMTEAERDLLIGPDNAELVKRIEDNLARWVLQGGSTKTETHGLLREAATALSRQQVPEGVDAKAARE